MLKSSIETRERFIIKREITGR